MDPRPPTLVAADRLRPCPDGAAEARRAVGGGLLRAWRARPFRRVAALLLALFLTVFQVESLIADVCDGDASPAERAAFAGPKSDLPPPEVVAAAKAPRSADEAAAGAVSKVPANDPLDFPVSGHPVHACHCVHAHSGVLSLGAVIPVAPAPVPVAVRAVSERTPPSATLERPPRPPAV